MKNEKIVSIDLGSAYTKVALRTGWNTETELVHDGALASREATFCIPSLVACVKRGGRENWLIGAAAANQIPGEGVRIYENWKAGLFGLHSSLTPEESRLAASQFFGSLRHNLSLGELWDDLDDLPLRICIPKLGDGNLSEGAIVQILEDAGWQCAKGRATVYEPESNAMGVLTRARNVTWVPPYEDFRPWLGRSVHLPRMLEPGLRRAFRNWATGNPYSVLVIDVGAFTTDFGHALFDTSFWTDEWNKPTINQQSVELGIRDLDREVRTQLSPEVQAVVEKTRPVDWELNKAGLYSGTEMAFRNPDGGMIVAGKGSEGDAIKKAVEAFAHRVVQARREFCDAHRLVKIDAQILTGGGAMISGLRHVVTTRGGTERASTIHDLLDEDEPRRVVPKRDGQDDERAIEDRGRQNRELVRGGSAIGGCSVFFE